MPKKGQRAVSLKDFENKLALASAIDWARLATFIDAEGTIYINRCQPRHAKSVQHLLSVTVANNSVLLMNWLQTKFGGSISQVAAKNYPVFNWRVNAKQASAILEGCLDYFVIRKEQAKAGVAFQATKFHGTNVEVPSDVLELRDSTRQFIRDLNMALNHDFVPKCEDTTNEEFAAKLGAASPVDLARLAAFLDSEGTIYINRHRRYKLSTIGHTLSTCIVNTSPQLLTWLIGNFGCRVYKHGSARKACWAWTPGTIKSEMLLRKCLPYFLVKGEQARLGIEFRDLIVAGNKYEIVGDDLRKREEIRNKIHLLNSPQLAKRVG